MLRYINASDVSKLLGNKYEFYWATQKENLDIINNRREKFIDKPQTFELQNKTVQIIHELPRHDLKKMISTFKSPDEILAVYQKAFETSSFTCNYCNSKFVRNDNIDNCCTLSKLLNKRHSSGTPNQIDFVKGDVKDEDEDEIDFKKMKIKDLKEILLGHDLSTKGKKQELIDRIKQFEDEEIYEDEEDEETEKIIQTINTNIVIDSLNEIKKESIHLPTHCEYITKTYDVFSKVVVPVLKTALDHDFTMERGNVEEEKIVKEFNIVKDNKLHFHEFDVNNQPYKVGCRYDGDKVEIKTRKSKFLGVPTYEKVQMHFYMATRNVLEWTLKEKYDDVVKDHIVQFDNTFFENVKNDLHKSWENLLIRPSAFSFIETDD